MKKEKIILFDVDQVLIRPPYYYSTELKKQGYKNAEEILTSFFTNGDYHRCSEGKADSLELIKPYLQKFGWKEGAKKYFLQQFQFEEKYLDQNLIFAVKKLKEQNVKCCLSTDQERNRAKYILSNMGFRDIFDKHFISCFIGYRKCHDEFWIYVLEELKKEFKEITTDDIVFFDDIQDNIDVALKFGIKAFLFTDTAQFKKDMKSLDLL